MKKPNRHPWLFGLCAALILLTGGMVVGMAARLVVFPQAQRTVEVETPDLPSFISQSMDEVEFYPWNRYDPENFSSDSSQIWDLYMEWCMASPIHSSELLELTLQDGWDDQEPLTDGDVCYWKDIPATTLHNNQPVLLDVGTGKDGPDFGLSMVARSTGELPTRAQKEAALDQVQRDVCALFDPQGGSGALYDTLQKLWDHLETYQIDSHNFVTWEGYGLRVVQMVYPPISDIAVIQDGMGQDPQQRLNALSQAAQSMDYHIQLVTTQRQVVVVLTQAYPSAGSWYSVGIYYDAELEAYSGVVLNSHHS